MSELNDLTIRSDTNEKEAVHAMKSEAEVRLMLQLRAHGVSTYEIARVLACSRNTVYRYLRQGGWQSSKPRRTRLSGHESWLAERFERHGGNADVIRQELRTERDIEVSLRTVERAVQPLRRRRRARQLATRRFETPPGDQLQVDFGQMPVTVDGRRTTVHLFVATLGYSRRQFVAAFENQSQRSWLDGMERAFRHFGGVPRTVLMDNPKALVTRPRGPEHGPTFNERLLAFAAYWRFQPRACHPYRARTKGKVERSVGYVKHNALAGRRFAGWGDLDRHLQRWLQTVADGRIMRTLGESPAQRFEWERERLTPVGRRPPFGTPEDLTRIVSRDCVVALDTNCYSVPWHLVGELVRLSVTVARVRVYHGSALVANHARCTGRHQRRLEASHFDLREAMPASGSPSPTDPSLVRPLAEYEAVAGGSWT